MNVHLLAVTVLAASSSGGESQKSGPIGLAVILVLCVACYFLFKSMSRHLRKVREEFPADAGSPPAATGAAAVGPGVGSTPPDPREPVGPAERSTSDAPHKHDAG